MSRRTHLKLSPEQLGLSQARIETLLRTNGHRYPTRTALAAAVGVAERTLYQWASGQRQPTLAGLCLLAEHFRVRLGWLAGLDEEEER